MAGLRDQNTANGTWYMKLLLKSCTVRSSLKRRSASSGHKISKIAHRASSQQRRAMGNPHPAAGFTLMEILLAFLILGIVMTTVLASFNAVFSTTDTLENSSRYHEMAKNCLSRIALDLEALYVLQPPLYKPPEFNESPDPYRIAGAVTDIGGTNFAQLRFTGRAHIPLEKDGPGGIAEIVYYVMAKNDGQPVLRRADHLYPYPSFEENAGDPILCEHIRSLVIRYYDKEGDESEEWNSDSDEYDHATPTAIGMQLEIGNDSESYIFETTVKLAVQRKKIGS